MKFIQKKKFLSNILLFDFYHKIIILVSIQIKRMLEILKLHFFKKFIHNFLEIKLSQKSIYLILVK